MGNPAWLLIVAADAELRGRLSQKLTGLGGARSVESAAAALEAIRREPPRVTVLASDLPVEDALAVVKGIGDPLSVVALVPAAGGDGVRLAEAGVAVQLPDSVPLAAVRRVVEQLRARATGEDAERLRQVLASVSHARHEVNNPLTSILAEAQLLLMDASTLPPEAQKSVQTIQEMAKRIRDVVRSLQSLRESP
jgi:signal transduction histidine kinase